MWEGALLEEAFGCATLEFLVVPSAVHRELRTVVTIVLITVLH